MVLELTETRGGKQQKYVVGITEDTGKSRIYIEDVEPDPVLGQRKRKFFTHLSVDADPLSAVGEVTAIRTEWREIILSATGLPMFGTDVLVFMITNPEDIAEFIQKFGMPIIMAMVNGVVRDNMGFNHLPIFDSITGAVKVYSDYETGTPPTWDYHTYKKGDPKPEILTEQDAAANITDPQ